MERLILFILYAVLLGVLPAHAIPSYYFKQISLKDGLSQSTVTSVLTDHQGVIWIGTRFGLNRFDQERITSYYHEKNNPASLPNNSILFLAEDSLSNIWIGTMDGLVRYNPGKDDFTRVMSGGLPLQAYSCLKMEDGMLFFGTGTVFKYSYRERKLMLMPVRSNTVMSDGFTNPVLFDKEKGIILLVSRWNGAWWYHTHTGKLERVPFIPEKEIEALCLASSGNIWVSPYGKGVYCYSPQGEFLQHLTAPDVLSHNIIKDIKEKDGELWLASDGGGINIYNLKEKSLRILESVSGDAYSLPTSSFGCLYSDSNNNMWAGSVRAGLIGMKKVYVHTYKEVRLNSTNGLSNKTVVGMYEGQDGFIWLGTDGGGVNRLDPQTRTILHYPSTFGKMVGSLIDFNGRQELLLSVFGEGLYRFDMRTGAISEFPVGSSSVYNRIFRMGNTVHLSRLDKNKFYLFADSVYMYDQNNGVLSCIPCADRNATVSSLHVICKDRDVTYLRGEKELFKLNHQDHTMSVLYSSNGAIETMEAACRDKEGNFWIGTTEGVYCLNPSTMQMKTVETDRFFGTTTLGFDSAGRLWVGTHNGLFVYFPASSRVMEFGESDGVYANEYVSKSPLLSASGDLYIAGVSGLIFVRKDMPLPEEDDPTVNLLDVELDGVSAVSRISKNGNRLVIPWNYTSLNARVIVKENDLMRRKIFRYYIRGQQEDVIESLNYRIAFHSLSAGEYHIWVSCNKKNGDWSTPVELLTVVVTPPWWKTSWFLFLLILLVVGGTALFIFLVMREKERRMVHVLREHERKNNEEKIRFLINISHELRTPLTLIYAPLKRLLSSGEVQNESLLKQLTAIFRQTHRIRDIINMVLDVRKMEMGGKMLQITKQAVNDWIQTVVTDFSPELEARHIKLIYDLDPSVGVIPFDAPKCEIVMSNLLMNALKFSDADTTVTLSTRLVPGYVRISLSDEGIGLEHVDVTRLFTRFYQGEHDRKGSGIGLSYAQMLIEMHGGRIGAQSNVGKGATFFFELPLVHGLAPVQVNPSINDLLAPSEEKTLEAAEFCVSAYAALVVEDELELRAYLKEMLSLYFKKVYAAEDGVQALELIRQNMPDVIISDVMMPRMNGFELCRKVKNDLDISHIPIVLLTARTDSESSVQAYKQGADVYVPKPFDLDFLLAILRNMLRGRDAVRRRYKDADRVIAPATDTISNADERFMQKLNDLISENLGNPDLDVNFIASEMAMSRASLYNKLKQLADVSIGDYVNKFRMAKALQLLADKRLSIQDVSEQTGFSHQRYFSTVFKQAYGMTPTQYRQQQNP